MIKFISSLAYACVAKLGYDPNMELLWTNKTWKYRITISGKDNYGRIATKVYETVDIIADTSYNLCGRATRVYEAYDIENPGTAVVIKDSWVDASHPKEADMLSELLDDASDNEKAMFMTVLLHGVVTIDGKEDLTRDLLMSGYLVRTNSIRKAKKHRDILDELAELMLDGDIADRGGEGTVRGDHHNIYQASIFELVKPSKLNLKSTTSVQSPDVSSPSLDHQTKRPPRVYGARAHYRIVFKERGASLHSLSCMCQINLPLVLQTMREIIKGNFILSHNSESF